MANAYVVKIPARLFQLILDSADSSGAKITLSGDVYELKTEPIVISCQNYAVRGDSE